ncbi:HTH tetR-type domain-containing protein [Mycobacterium sp. smrl_JER01]
MTLFTKLGWRRKPPHRNREVYNPSMAIHRGLTADQRRELRRHQLIQAALDAIAEDGVRNLRVRAISGRARLNDRYFYESFRDCQELLLAAFDDQFTLALSGIMATLSDAPLELEARARTILEFAFGFLDEDPRRQRLLVELQTAEALAPRRQEVTDVLTRIMVGQIRQLLGERAGTDDTVTLTALTVSSGLLELAAQWYRKQVEVSRSQLIEFATALVVTTSDITGAVERQIASPKSGNADGDR